MRYLNIFFLSKPNEIYKYGLERYAQNRSTILFEDSKFEELFEISDKAEYLAYSMLEIDIAELSTIDNFKENYTFTVNKKN